jgi:hypothetical protein
VSTAILYNRSISRMFRRAHLYRVSFVVAPCSNASLLSFTNGGFEPDDGGGGGDDGGLAMDLRSTAAESSVRPVVDRVTRDEDLNEAEEGESGMSGLSYEYLR